MESTNLNATAANADPLDARLRQALPPLSDEGFAVHVLAALPETKSAPARTPSKWIFCGVGALVGLAFFVVRAGSWSNAGNGLVEATSALSIFSEPLVLWAVAATVVSLLLVPLGQNRRF